jgi:hypothetical protein
VTGTGALKRRDPVGGKAYGNPSHFSNPGVVETPRKVPVFNGTSRGNEAVDAE